MKTPEERAAALLDGIRGIAFKAVGTTMETAHIREIRVGEDGVQWLQELIATAIREDRLEAVAEERKACKLIALGYWGISEDKTALLIAEKIEQRKELKP